MILKKEAISDDDTSISNKQSSKTNEKSSDASSSTICNFRIFDWLINELD